MLAPYAGHDRAGSKCDVSKWLKPDEGHMTHSSSPFVMWLVERLQRR
jgi:hypothetical protein